MAPYRSNTKKSSPDIGLFMECIEEELEPSQIMYFSNAEKEYNEIQTKLDYYIKKLKAEIIEKGENFLALQFNVTPPTESVNSLRQISSSEISGQNTKQSVQNNQGYQQVVGSGILSRSSNNPPGNTYLVMDSGLSFMVGQMPPTNILEQSSSHSKSTPGGRNRQSVTTRPLMVATRAKLSSKRQASASVDSDYLISPSTKTRDNTKSQLLSHHQTPSSSCQVISEQVYSSESSLSSCGNYRLKASAKPLPVFLKPGESNSLGGLTAGTKICGKSSNEEFTGNEKCADSREIAFNKITGKTFPSLVVIARPHLKAKYIHHSKIVQERSALDSKVKSVLMYTPTKFTEWLIQQGLIKSEQICQSHLNIDLSPVKLKLGMYSDISKFPHSGGYVWISDCCPNQFVSVFSGSIFEGAPHSPTTLLKLIYHWACQTNIQNIIQWVKVDNLYVRNFFTNMRAICTQAVHEKYKKMGGQRKKIEVGVISLGTTSQDGNKRQVKVEVLGVMDHENKLIRLRAVEPHSDERSFKRRFVRILQPLEEWVSKDSTILTDFTVNKAALNSMGFHTVFQVTSDVKYSNQNVMEYLRKIVPRMFQNTLSLLSRQIIQQFLDELVWREVWGPIPSQAFVTIIAHMSEQMKLDVNENFLVRLNQVASNPFKEWKYSVWTPATSSKGTLKNQSQKSPKSSVSQETLTMIDSPEFVTNPGKFSRTRKRGPEQCMTEMPGISSPTKKLARIAVPEKIRKEKESGEKLSEEIIKFIDGGTQIPLEPYYYGFIKGIEANEQHSSVPFSVKCCVCNRRFTENIALMKHMLLHCQVEPVLVTNLKEVLQCKICFLGFNTNISLKTHLETVHFLIDDKLISNNLCHICEKKFVSQTDVVYHMQRTHIEKDLPYECGVCRFRTSVYRFFVRHFVQVHKGEEYVFCPFCLKTVALFYKNGPITSNVQFYLSHLEKHYRPSLTKDCGHCRLSFIHKGILDQHLEADHNSWKTEPGVEPLSELCTGLLMPEPGSLIKFEPMLQICRPQKMKNSFSVNKFRSLNVQDLDEDCTCFECEEFLSKSDHFTGNFTCLKCRFATCCERAMLEHSTIFHEMPVLRFTMGKPTTLENEMFCACGYSNRSGNRIAKHLALCEKKTAYANLDSALDAVEENSKGENQNVLNLLGLVRKSPENNTADKEESATELSQKKDLNFSEIFEVDRVDGAENENGENSKIETFVNSSNPDGSNKDDEESSEKESESAHCENETQTPTVDESIENRNEIQLLEIKNDSSAKPDENESVDLREEKLEVKCETDNTVATPILSMKNDETKEIVELQEQEGEETVTIKQREEKEIIFSRSVESEIENTEKLEEGMGNDSNDKSKVNNFSEETQKNEIN